MARGGGGGGGGEHNVWGVPPPSRGGAFAPGLTGKASSGASRLSKGSGGGAGGGGNGGGSGEAGAKPKRKWRRRRKAPGCTCKKSNCLKLYCECFSAEAFCGPKCKCHECKNLPGVEYTAIREKAKAAALKRKPMAFSNKKQVQLVRGCNCRKSNCLKVPHHLFMKPNT